MNALSKVDSLAFKLGENYDTSLEGEDVEYYSTLLTNFDAHDLEMLEVFLNDKEGANYYVISTSNTSGTFSKTDESPSAILEGLLNTSSNHKPRYYYIFSNGAFLSYDTQPLADIFVN